MSKQIRIHWFQHMPFEGLGCIEDWVKRENHQLSCTRFYANDPLPSLDDFDWLIIMGGPMGIYDEDKYPWLDAEKEFIRLAITDRKMVLGICLGSQLLSDALGGRVRPGKNKEIGWFPVTKTETGRSSAILKSMPDEMNVFHWHGDQFEIPDGCHGLAESVACPSQILLHRDQVLGLQFHFEATEQSVHSMLEHLRDELKEQGPFIQSEEEIIAGLSNCDEGNRVMFSILDRLAKIV